MRKITGSIAALLLGCASAGGIVSTGGLPWFVADYTILDATKWPQSRIDEVLQSALTLDEQRLVVSYNGHICNALEGRTIPVSQLSRFSGLLQNSDLEPEALSYRVLCPNFPFTEFILVRFRGDLSGIVVPMDGATFLFKPQVAY